MMRRFNITIITKVSGVLLCIALTGCGPIRARLDALPTTRVTTLPATQTCDAPEQNENRLTGAYLRQSDASGLTFVPVMVTGRENRNGLTENVTVNDQSQTREVAQSGLTTFEGSKDAVAKALPGFGPTGILPNVYDVTYSAKDTTFRGPMVLGPGSFNREIPSSGARLFTGSIALTLITQTEDGAPSELSARGRFSMEAGYGSARGSLTANGFDAALPFESLKWRNLFLCGTRFVSSGQGVVTVQTENGPPLPPFKADREAAAFTALFESGQFTPQDRLGPPVAIGGVFVIQSDSGTLTGVFLSDQPAIVEVEIDA
ncbi:MAG: hypothetical protein AB8B62_05310 [Roseobacter sp.]